MKEKLFYYPYVFRDQSELSEGSIEMNASVELTVHGFLEF
jgi:hypothetical protein